MNSSETNFWNMLMASAEIESVESTTESLTEPSADKSIRTVQLIPIINLDEHVSGVYKWLNPEFKNKIPVKPKARNGKFPPEITNVLDKYFQIDPKPVMSKMVEYAKELGLLDSQVKDWFKNNQRRRRYRFNRKQKRLMQDILDIGDVNEKDKVDLAMKFGINVKYVKYWFYNAQKN